MKIVIVLFLTILSFNAMATRQLSDTIRIDNQLYLMHVSLAYNNPVLEYYLVNKKHDSFISNSFSTGCYRHHIASYSIENDSIFIDKISIIGSRYYNEKTKMRETIYKNIDLDKHFEVEKIRGKIFTEWFTGYLRIETLHYTLKRKQPCGTSDSLTTHESDEYKILKVIKGRVIESATYNNLNFWALQWNCESNYSDEGKKLYEEYDKWVDKKSYEYKYWKEN